MLSGFFGSDDLFLAAGKSPSGVPKDIQYVEDKYFGCGPLAGLHAALGRIYNSNLYLFRSLLLREGYQIDRCASLPDDAEQISDALGHLAQGHDLILTTGGASVGDRDHAGSALEQAGADILFSHIRMKPGSCCFAAVLGQAVILSRSGNPGAALTTYFRVALPVVRRIAGRHDFALLERGLPLKEDVRKTCPAPRILKGHVELENSVAYFVGHEGQKTGCSGNP